MGDPAILFPNSNSPDFVKMLEGLDTAQLQDHLEEQGMLDDLQTV